MMVRRTRRIFGDGDMLTVVIYDISDTKVRKRVAEACKDFGLIRTQLSAFEGFLSSEKRAFLAKRLSRLLKGKIGEVQVYTSCKNEWPDHVRITTSGISKKQYQERRNLLYIS